MNDLHLRCDICNYCRATDGPRKRVTMALDTQTQKTLCSTCAKASQDTEEKTEPDTVELFFPTPEKDVVKTPTLPKVTGVNDGPEHRRFDDDEQATEEAGAVPEADEGSSDPIPVAT